MSLENSFVRFRWLPPVPPHPGPLPQGEGTPHPALRRVEGLWIVESAASDTPSPRGEGWGEGEGTLETPMRSRTFRRPRNPPWPFSQFSNFQLKVQGASPQQRKGERDRLGRTVGVPPTESHCCIFHRWVKLFRLTLIISSPFHLSSQPLNHAFPTASSGASSANGR